MKIKLGISALLFLMCVGTNVSAQTAPTVARGVACSVNDGYSMSDVVEFARNIEWDADLAPSGLFFREAFLTCFLGRSTHRLMVDVIADSFTVLAPASMA